MGGGPPAEPHGARLNRGRHAASRCTSAAFSASICASFRRRLISAECTFHGGGSPDVDNDEEFDGEGGPRRFGRLRCRYTTDPDRGCAAVWPVRKKLRERFLCGSARAY